MEYGKCLIHLGEEKTETFLAILVSNIGEMFDTFVRRNWDVYYLPSDGIMENVWYI